MPVKIRFHPKIYEKEQTFFHITSEDLSKGLIDPNDRILIFVDVNELLGQEA
jgi:hypothetical protein